MGWSGRRAVRGVGADPARTRAALRTAVRVNGLPAAKSATAAVLAWLAAGWLLPSGAGFYAPLVAVLSVHPTVVKTLRDVVQRLVAVGLGLGMGWVVSVTVGLHWWSLGPLLAVAFLASGWRRLGEEGVQVPVGALFVLVFAQDPTTYVTQLLVEGVIGSVVAAAVNIAVAPPLQLTAADQALADLRRALGDLVDDMSAGVGAEPPAGPPADPPGWLQRARDMTGRLEAARTAVREGGESTVLNPRARRWREAPPEQRAAFSALEQVTLVVRELAGTLEEAVDPGDPALTLNPAFRPDLADALRSLADALTAHGEEHAAAEATDSAAQGSAVERAAEQIGRLRGRVEDWQLLELPTLLAEGAVVTQLERAVRILQAGPLH